MANNDSLDPTGKNTSKKAPLGDPSAPPNPSTREAVAQTESKRNSAGSTTSTTTGASGSGSVEAAGTSGAAGGTSKSGTTATSGTTGTSGATGTSASGTSGTAGASKTGSGSASASASGHSQSPEQKQKLREEINETGEKLKSEAREAARGFADSARARAEAQAEHQQRAAAGELGGIASALRKTADEVQGQSYLPLDRYARQAADKLDDLSQSLQGSDVRSMVHRLESYTREQPGVVLGGAIISGFLLARFMRASAEHEESARGYRNAPGHNRSPSSNTGYYPGDHSV